MILLVKGSALIVICTYKLYRDNLLVNTLPNTVQKKELVHPVLKINKKQYFEYQLLNYLHLNVGGGISQQLVYLYILKLCNYLDKNKLYFTLHYKYFCQKQSSDCDTPKSSANKTSDLTELHFHLISAHFHWIGENLLSFHLIPKMEPFTLYLTPETVFWL